MKEFIKQHIYIILGIACIALMGVLFAVSENRPTRRGGELLASLPAGAVSPREDSGYIVVHVAGEVHTPGVYTLPAGTRVNDAVEMAGGYTPEADLTRINLAAPLQDAMQVIVPAAGDYSVAGAPGTDNNGLINLNTASPDALQTLPGIGPARAQSIVDYRESIGGFTQIEELMNISGIGNAIFNGLKDLITVR
jgi:competence protein ComEA